MIYFGVCESRDDPLKLGRLQVRVFGVHSENKLKVPTESLPWATVLKPSTGSSLSGIGESTSIVEGSTVSVLFLDGDAKQRPLVLGTVAGIPQSKFWTDDVITDEGAAVPSDSVVLSDVNTPPEKLQDPVVETPTKSDLDISGYTRKYGPNAKLVKDACISAGITNPFSINAIIANCVKESKLRPIEENLNYTNLSRLREIFSSATKNLSDQEASALLNNPVGLGNFVYDNKNGNGQGEGYAYRGRGFIQVTFKNNYNRIGRIIGVDLVRDPDLLLIEENSAKAAVTFFTINANLGILNSYLSQDEANRKVTQIVVGRNLNLSVGVGANQLAIVTEASKLGKVIGDRVVTDSGSVTEGDTAAKKADRATGVNDTQVAQVSNNPFGFADPNAKYPNLLKEPDTNRLARRIIKGTIVEQKQAQRTKSIRTVGGTFAQPQSPYNARYPFNDIKVSESGHVFEFDDTPNAERINLFHTTGTFTEIDAFGNRVNKIVGDSYEIIDRNGYVHIRGTARITVEGNANIVVGGNANLEVDGAMNTTVGGDYTLKVGGSYRMQSGGKASIRAGGQVGIDGSQVYWNSGVADSPGVSSKSPGDVQDFEPNFPEPATGEDVFILDDADSRAVDNYEDKALQSGVITEEEKKAAEEIQVVEEDITSAANDIRPLPAGCEIFANMTSIPDTYKISKNFTIASLTTKAYFGHKLKANKGLSEKEIACNLKKLAQNCLDKIQDQFPTMFITSGFRPNQNGSQHNLGQACDMQFRGFSKADYFEAAKWIRDNVLFDQLLLEYKTTGSGQPWIHISFRDNPRRDVQTFLNDRSKGKGLQKLQ